MTSHEQLFSATADIAVARAKVDAVVDWQSYLADIYAGLAALGRPVETPVERVKPRGEPAVPVAESVHREYIVCLEDGKKFKSLKRHLHVLGMTPKAYRERWGLPADYPMVAAAYAARRTEIARANGLGQRSVPKIAP